MKSIFKYFFAVVFIFMISCKNEVIEDVQVGYEYFPLKEGNWYVYQVDSIVYDDFTGRVDSFKFQLRELVESRFTDAEGRETFRIERFKRSSGNADWQIKNVWSANLYAQSAHRTEENQRIIKLVFPLRLGKEWNGNAFNTGPAKDYRLNKLDFNTDILGRNYTQVLQVLQEDEENLIQKDYAEEQYAKGVGLIYKEQTHLETDVNGNINKGLVYRLKLLDFHVQ